LFATQGGSRGGNFPFGALRGRYGRLGERIPEVQETMVALAAAVWTISDHMREMLTPARPVGTMRTIGFAFGTKHT
jgi:hypothetical protein